jgi:hypothetical protein
MVSDDEARPVAMYAQDASALCLDLFCKRISYVMSGLWVPGCG